MSMFFPQYYLSTTGGGLGNQIFVYALYFYLKETGCRASCYLLRDDFVTVFGSVGANEHVGRDKVVRNCVLGLNKVLRRVRRTLGLHHKTDYLKFGNLWYVDYAQWNSYLFLSDIRPKLLKRLVFPPDDDVRNDEVRRRMLATQSVSIHVRRGDYQRAVYWRLLLGDICDVDYYNDAVSFVKSRMERPTFFVFSDDIGWAQQHLDIDDAVYIDWNVGERSFRDMELMTYAKCNIIANSSFSLAAAWLNRHEMPLRVAPRKWTNSVDDCYCRKFIPEAWHVVDNRRPQISIVADAPLLKSDVRHILAQTFTDYEVLSPEPQATDDSRFHKGLPTGRHVLNFTESAATDMADSTFLFRWLSNEFCQDGSI